MRSFPFDSLALYQDENTGLWMGDRQGSAQDVRDINKLFWSNGVYMGSQNAFQVTPGEGMNVIVSPGICSIEGALGIEVNTRELALQEATSEDRIDTIVLRCDFNVESRKIDLYTKTGVASSVPVRPTLTRTESVWELGIDDVFVPKNSTSVSASRMTDTRLETSRCGVMTPFMKIDTETFYAQITAIINQTGEHSDDIIKALENSSSAQIRQLQAATDKAVELAKSLVDETFAGDILSALESIAVEHTLYTTVDDSVSDPLTDENDEKIGGAVVFRTAMKERK